MAQNRSLGFSLLALVLGMLMLAYASVPLYRLFCKATGFGGTTQVANAPPLKTYDRMITIRFNADTEPALPWDFAPSEKEVRIHVGEQHHTFYTAYNKAKTPITGQAAYNVAPDSAGIYFNKIQCFCFEKQTLKPHEHAKMPITFFIDPKILNDPSMDSVDTITLSYTFFQVKDSKK